MAIELKKMDPKKFRKEPVRWGNALFTLEGVNKRIEMIKPELSRIEEKYMSIINTENIIDQQLNELEAREAKFFEILRLPDTKGGDPIKDLKERIRKYNKVTFELSGPRLYEVFIAPAETSLKSYNERLQKEFQYFVGKELEERGADLDSPEYQQVLLDFLNELLEPIIGKNGKTVIRFEGKTTQKGTIKGGNKIRSRKGYEDKFTGVYIKLLADKQQQLIKEWIKQQKNLSEDKKAVRQEINRNASTTIVNWVTLTRGSNSTKPMTSKEAEEYYEKRKKRDPDILKKVQNNLIKYILDNLKGADSEQKARIREILEYMLSLHPYSFFVGENLEGITGFLGELQSLYYIDCITDHQYLNNGLTWVGDTLDDKKKKSSVDLILQGIGIQVKNTTKDLFKDAKTNAINFSKLSLDSFLTKIGLDEQDKQIIASIYGTYYFNIPFNYKMEGEERNAEAGENSEYTPTYEQLRSLVRATEKLYAFFAGTLMNIFMKNTTEIQPGTTVFMLGSEGVKMASEVLLDIFEKIPFYGKKGKDGALLQDTFNFQTYSTISDEENIVSYINNKKRYKNILAGTLSKIKLTSSYVFTDIL